MTTSTQTIKALKIHDDGIFKKLPRILPKLPSSQNLEFIQHNPCVDNESETVFDFKVYHSE